MLAFSSSGRSVAARIFLIIGKSPATCCPAKAMVATPRDWALAACDGDRPIALSGAASALLFLAKGRAFCYQGAFAV